MYHFYSTLILSIYSNFLKIRFIYVYKCFVYMHVCAPRMYLVPSNIRKWHQSPWIYWCLGVPMRVPRTKPSPLREQSVPLAAEHLRSPVCSNLNGVGRTLDGCVLQPLREPNSVCISSVPFSLEHFHSCSLCLMTLMLFNCGTSSF